MQLLSMTNVYSKNSNLFLLLVLVYTIPLFSFKNKETTDCQFPMKQNLIKYLDNNLLNDTNVLKNATPNIILILADDMGYSDIGCYGGEINTPNLNKLAANGLRFSQFYNGARCCPTRATLLTGLYAHQTGIGSMVGPSQPGSPGYAGDLNKNCITIGEVLKNSGYETFMAGKWHISQSTDTSDIHNWPLQRGFDKFYGIITGAGSYYNPGTLTYNNTPAKISDDYYFTDAISDSMASFITSHTMKNPFFGYLAFTAPHWPLHAPENDVKKYYGKFSNGWDTLREQRLTRMQKIGLIDSGVKLSERDVNVIDWNSVEDKKNEERKMEVYAAMIERMDIGIGKVLRSLENTDQLNNTLIIFLSDNGACAEFLGKDMSWVKEYGPSTTKEGKKVIYGNDAGVLPGGDDSYQSYGIGWANLSNTPFKLYKHYIQEGGIATPLIINWPNGIPTKMNGSILTNVSHIIDIMPTLIDLTSTIYPKIYNGSLIYPLEGESFAKLIMGDNSWEKKKPTFWEHEKNSGMRDGDWKITKIFNNDWELFNLKNDRIEQNNLSKKYSKRYKSMIYNWNLWAKRVFVN